MKFTELADKSAEDLEKQLLELRKEQFNLRLQKGTGQLSQTHMITGVRKDIARIKTQLSSLRNNANV